MFGKATGESSTGEFPDERDLRPQQQACFSFPAAFSHWSWPGVAKRFQLAPLGARS